jgi:phosphate transport system substrate-binding protein
MAGLSMGCRSYTPPPKYDLRLAGAQIPVELVESWLKSSRSPRFITERVQPVAWSEAGFEHLQRGECDIACTDRRLTEREIGKFGDRDIQGYRVAFYGYALYVHPDNPLDSIFAGHIELLFRGRITDWKELGAHQGPIRLIGPRKSTRGGFILMRQARIWFDNPTWEAMNSDAEIVEAVASDPLALGFASIGLDEDARYLGLRMRRDGSPAFPSLEEIESERYGLAKVIYVYFPVEGGETADAVLDFLYSEEAGAEMETADVWQTPRERGPVEPLR